MYTGRLNIQWRIRTEDERCLSVFNVISSGLKSSVSSKVKLLIIKINVINE